MFESETSSQVGAPTALDDAAVIDALGSSARETATGEPLEPEASGVRQAAAELLAGKSLRRIVHRVERARFN